MEGAATATGDPGEPARNAARHGVRERAAGYGALPARELVIRARTTPEPVSPREQVSEPATAHAAPGESTRVEEVMSAHPLDQESRARLRSAAHRVTRIYPGPVGELLERELRTWEEFGFRFGSAGLLAALVDHVLTAPIGQLDPVRPDAA